jgi:hypothetical protein
MKPAGGVLLDDEPVALAPCRAPARLRRHVEPALPAIGFEGHDRVSLARRSSPPELRHLVTARLSGACRKDRRPARRLTLVEAPAPAAGGFPAQLRHALHARGGLLSPGQERRLGAVVPPRQRENERRVKELPGKRFIRRRCLV